MRWVGIVPDMPDCMVIYLYNNSSLLGELVLVLYRRQRR
jgi:hypothetical protein